MFASLAARFARLPKPVRFMLRALGTLLAFITSPAWFPLSCVLWVICKVSLEIIEFYRKS